MARVNVKVRPAEVGDVLDLAALVQAIDTRSGTFSGKPLADTSTEHLATRFQQILEHEERMLLVACDESGAVVGMLAARGDELGAVDLTEVLHVTHLMVLPGNRRRGIGRALLTAMLHLAEETGIENVLAGVSAGSREGNRYLARIGFAPLVVIRIASTSTLRRSLCAGDAGGRVAVLRRARLVRAQRAGFAARTATPSG